MREVSRRILLRRKYDRQWKTIAWPLLVVWFAWFFIETSYANGHFSLSPFSAGGIAGGFIGIIFGSIYMHRYNTTLRQLEQQIKDFAEAEDEE